MTGGHHSETPLRWAASSDDVDVADVLIEGGAEVEAPGSAAGGGPPLVNAVAFGCWHVVRLLVARGAPVDTLWQAAGLGLARRVDDLMACRTPPTADEVNHAFWQACHGGQRRVPRSLSASVPMSIGRPITATAPHWTSSAGPTHAEKGSSSGFVSTAPDRPPGGRCDQNLAVGIWSHRWRRPASAEGSG